MHAILILRRFTGCRRGSMLTEFGLVLPILVLLLVGVTDFGVAVYEHMDVRAAARAAAQYARQNPTDTAGIEQTARNALGGSAGSTTVVTSTFCECADGTSVNCSNYCPSNATPRRFISVKVTEQHATIVPYPGFDNTLALNSLATFRVQ
jgi:Flp pilus assembly protein TadG